MFIEPDELAKTVGTARFAPPKVQLAGLVEAVGGVGVPPLLQERRDCFQPGEARPLFFSEVVHSLTVRHEQRPRLCFCVATIGCQTEPGDATRSGAALWRNELP